MSNVVPIAADDALLEAASRWMLKIDENELSEDEQAALEAWLDEDVRHRELLCEVAEVWDKSDSLARLADFFPHEAATQASAPRFSLWPIGIAVTASFVLVMVALVLPRFENPLGQEAVFAATTALFETAVGEQKTVLLPDGSEVILNTNTQLRLSYTASARVLQLVQGEIFVKVKKEQERPLSVVAHDRIIQAVGTEFAVELMPNQKVELMVTEGRVVVGVQLLAEAGAGLTQRLEIAGRAVPALLAQNDEDLVSAGERVVLGAQASVKQVVSSDDLDVKLSWREGRLIFRSEPLANVLQEIGRYTQIEFVFLDENLKSRTLSGRFRTDDVEALLVLLEVNFSISHKFDGKNRILLSGL